MAVMASLKVKLSKNKKDYASVIPSSEVPSGLDFHLDSGYSICQGCPGQKDSHSFLNWLVESVKVVGYPATRNKPWSGF